MVVHVVICRRYEYCDDGVIWFHSWFYLSLRAILMPFCLSSPPFLCLFRFDPSSLSLPFPVHLLWRPINFLSFSSVYLTRNLGQILSPSHLLPFDHSLLFPLSLFSPNRAGPSAFHRIHWVPFRARFIGIIS